MRLRMKVDTSAIDKALKEFEDERKETLERVGQQAVAYAVENGEYHDVTGRLRRSNGYKVTDKGLTIYNTAPYAEEVQNRGLDVIGGAALFARYELEKQARK
ncbi:MAG: HK97 gp10 family phage protein [Bacteroidales bacterium]|nr:HK97 gp10 family phage protein [Bacteroidales bacterium]